jgi:hypothetical protein
MKMRWLIALVAIGSVLVILPRVSYAAALDEARQAVQQSGSTALETLDRVSDQVADDAKKTIRDAKQRVLESRENALQSLDKAERGRIAEKEGLATAIEATEKHQAVLREVLDKVPPEAKGAITHAMEVSRHGNDTVRALHAGSVGKDLSGRPDVSKRPAVDRPRTLEQPRDMGRPMPTVPAGPRSGFSPAGR